MILEHEVWQLAKKRYKDEVYKWFITKLPATGVSPKNMLRSGRGSELLRVLKNEIHTPHTPSGD